MTSVFRMPSFIFRFPAAFLSAVLLLGFSNIQSAPEAAGRPETNTLRALSATNITTDTRIPPTVPLPKTDGLDLNALHLLAQADTPAQPKAPAPAAPAAPVADGGGRRGGRGGSDPVDAMLVDGDKVSLQFPNNTITDILGIYERLTNKTLVKDTNIFEGQPISLVTPQPVEKAEAIKLIESSMLTNGYVIVADPDGKSARILPTRAKDSKDLQFSQGVKFYQSAKDLPDNETIVSFFMKLDHLDPTLAGTMLGNHVGLNVYGRITPVTVPAGLLITESATIVKQLVSIKEVIDAADSSNALITKFIPLKYADAATVAQIIQATLDAQAQDKDQKGLTTIRGSGPVHSKEAAPAAAASLSALATSGGGVKKPQAKSQVVADGRLNQLLVVAEPDNYAYVISLIAEFDKPVEVPDAYERQLKNVFAVDVLGVLADLLKETTKGGTQLPGGGSLSSGQQNQITASNSLLTGRSSSTSQRGGSFVNANGTSSGATGAATGKPDQLIEAQQDNAPIGVLINKTRIIADPLANSIIVIGPKEDKDKVKQLLDKLDRKPPQVYMATVIGQLSLADGMNFGIDYLQHFSQIGNESGMASSFIQARKDIVTPPAKNIADLRNNAITTLIGPAAGLNVYGQITKALDVFVTALETTNDFKIISRPSVFALNNRKAVISSGQSVPVPESILTQAVSNVNNSGNTTTNVTYKDVVLKLEVIPLINPDGLVTLKIAQVNDTLQGERLISGNLVPVIGTEQITTTVTVPSGKTIVLGGLITEQEKKDIGGIPVLQRIPLIGNLFKNTVKSKQRSELLIFIQPTVINGDQEMYRASLSEDIRTGVGGDAYSAFPDKVWPKAFPVEDAQVIPRTTSSEVILRRDMQPSP